ncbi:MAG: B12-binding domain-containing radical SAM protein [Planctomycetota bacterium]
MALVALNVPGYYSLPIRTLFLLIRESNELSKNFAMRFIEMDVDQNADNILTVFTAWQPDLIGLSVNIWNRNNCIRLAQAIKFRLPKSVILAGGQEVTGSVIDYLDFVPEFDYVIDGEGEIPFQQFLKNWDPVMRTLRDPKSVSGLHYRIGNRNAITGPARLVNVLDQIPSPILAGLVPIGAKQKLGVLLEASRGCPFRCSFCFEGSKHGSLRTVSVERLIQEIDFVVNQGGSYFHIMDPILCMKDPKRLRQLTEHIKNLSKDKAKIIFSVEAYAEHITEDVAECLKACAIIDVGLQSINPATLKEIHRKYIPDKFQRGLNHLRQVGASFNLYLICGLPYETMATYLGGVAYVIREQPTRVFFNELYLLNGTELRKRADEYGYRFSPDPPYQVYQTKWMAPDALIFARSLSKALEKQYNLSSQAIYAGMPWVGVKNMKGNGTLSCHIKAACSIKCANCSIWNTSYSNLPLDSPPASTAQSDVAIHTGDGVDQHTLLQLLGQLHLAGAARIILHVPPLLLCDPNFVELLIHRGVWHFITFAGAPDAVSRDYEFDAHSQQLSTALGNLNRTFALRGRARIRPFVEVMINPNRTGLTAIRQQIKTLVSCNVSMINISDTVQRSGDAWVDALAEMFAAELTPRCWLKMPQGVIRRVLKDIDNVNEIIALLDQLNLLSRKSVHPPCLWVETRKTEPAWIDA